MDTQFRGAEEAHPMGEDATLPSVRRERAAIVQPYALCTLVGGDGLCAINAVAQ
jgi:hypothetical protein